jgi:hypothetical protein
VTARLVIDGRGVAVEAPVGRAFIAWVDLVAVEIHTTAAGPAEDDFFWELRSRDGSTLTIGPQIAGVADLLERLQRLPGFDNEAVVAASASTAHARFTCWSRRTVTLRDEREGADTRWLGASVDAGGALHIDGHDLGPGTAMVSSDGEYEWFKTVAAADVPRLVTALGGQAGDDVLDLLEREWTGPRSYEFERLLRESDIPVSLFTWGG